MDPKPEVPRRRIYIAVHHIPPPERRPRRDAFGNKLWFAWADEYEAAYLDSAEETTPDE